MAQIFIAGLDKSPQAGEITRSTPPCHTLWGNYPLIKDKYSKAEPLFIRSLSIAEQEMGPNNPIVAKILTNYSSLLQGIGRSDEADAKEVRAGTIHAKHAESDLSS